MSTTLDEALIDRLIREREGTAFTNDARDGGGPTRFGITKRTLSEWRGHAVTVADVKNLTEAEARQIYRHEYLLPFAMVTDVPLKELLFDCAVLEGVGRAKRFLQEVLGVEVDGVIGPETKAALEQANLVGIYRLVLRRRFRHIGEVLRADHEQAAFASGWLNRLAEFI